MLVLNSLNPFVALSTALLGPSLVRLVYSGPTCGDVYGYNCPGEPYSGSSFEGVVCVDNQYIFAPLVTQLWR